MSARKGIVHSQSLKIEETYRNDILNYHITHFFEQDILNLREYPDEEIRKIFKRATVHYQFDLTKLPKTLKQEIKDFIRSDLTRLRKDNGTLVLNSIRPINTAIEYMCYLGKESILDYIDDDIKAYSNYYANHHSGYCPTTNMIILSKLQMFTLITKEKNIKNVFERNLWDPKELKISPDRIDPTKEIGYYSFFKLKNEKNRNLLKAYLEYQISLTNAALSSIHREYQVLYKFCEFHEDANIDNLTREEGLEYLSYLEESNISNRTFTAYLRIVLRFYNYLSMRKGLKSCPFSTDDCIKTKYDYKEIALDDYVLQQIFNCLGSLKNSKEIIFNMYLVNACTGIRVSEICALKIGCLRKETEFCMLKYFSIKMRKDCYILIPHELYKILNAWEKKRISEDSNAIYMFPSIQNPKTTPYLTKQYCREMKKFIAENQITEQNGEPYIFRSHAYRHTLAKDLVDADVPIFVISQILSHSSVQMTLAYAELRDEKKQEKFEKYVKAIEGLDEIAKSEITTEWLRENLKKQILPNGYCTLPCKMSCPHLGRCLHCESFITTLDFYDVLSKQLEELEELLPEYESKGMLTKVATAKKDIEKLYDLLNKLERMED